MSPTPYDLTTAARTPPLKASASKSRTAAFRSSPSASPATTSTTSMPWSGSPDTKARGLLLGAAAGAWVGLLVGMLLALTTVGPVSPLFFLGSLTVGAFGGAVLGFVGHWRDQAGAKSRAPRA